MNVTAPTNLITSIAIHQPTSLKQGFRDFVSSTVLLAKKIQLFVIPIFKVMGAGLLLGILTYINPTLVVVGCLVGLIADHAISRMIDNIKNIWKVHSICTRAIFIVGAFLVAAESIMVTSLLVPAYIVSQLSLEAHKSRLFLSNQRA